MFSRVLVSLIRFMWASVLFVPYRRCAGLASLSDPKIGEMGQRPQIVYSTPTQPPTQPSYSTVTQPHPKFRSFPDARNPEEDDPPTTTTGGPIK